MKKTEQVERSGRHHVSARSQKQLKISSTEENSKTTYRKPSHIMVLLRKKNTIYLIRYLEHLIQRQKKCFPREEKSFKSARRDR